MITKTQNGLEGVDSADQKVNGYFTFILNSGSTIERSYIYPTEFEETEEVDCQSLLERAKEISVLCGFSIADALAASLPIAAKGGRTDQGYRQFIAHMIAKNLDTNYFIVEASYSPNRVQSLVTPFYGADHASVCTAIDRRVKTLMPKVNAA